MQILEWPLRSCSARLWLALFRIPAQGMAPAPNPAKFWVDFGRICTTYTREVRNSLEVFEMTLNEVSSYESYSELESNNREQNYAV